MPNVARKVDGKWRVIDKDTGNPTKNASGTAVDGGGHPNKDAARRQAEAINIHQAKKK